MSDFYDAFQELKGLEDATFSFDKPGILKLNTFLNMDDNEDNTLIVVDPDAETAEDTQGKDYNGEVILKCNVCGGLITKVPEDVVIDDETQKANVEEECPYCYNIGGYDIVGEVKVPETLEYEEVDEFGDRTNDTEKDAVGYDIPSDDNIEEGKEAKDLSEDYDKDAGQIAKFIEDAVNGLKNGEATNYRYKLDDRLAIFVGWSDGYSEDDETVIHNAENPTEGITAGIKVWTSDDMWTDFDYLNAPYYESGEVLSDELSIDPEDDFAWLGAHFLNDYETDYRDLTVDEDGKVIEEKEEIEESLNEAKNPKFIGKKGRPLTEDEIDKFVDVINRAVGQLSYKGYRRIFDVNSISVDESNNVEQKSPYADPYVKITLPTITLGSRKFKNFYGDTITDINNIIFNCRYREGYTEGTDEDLDEGQYAVKITTDGTKKGYKQRADKKYRWEGTDCYLYDDTISEFESGIKNWIAKFIDEILGNSPKSFTSQPYYGEESAKYEEPSLQFTNEDLSKDAVNIIGRKEAAKRFNKGEEIYVGLKGNRDLWGFVKDDETPTFKDVEDYVTDDGAVKASDIVYAVANTSKTESCSRKEKKSLKESGEKTPTDLFKDYLDLTEFALEKDGDSYRLIDLQGGNLGNIESDRFDSAKEIFDRMDAYIYDYYVRPIEEEAENFGFELPDGDLEALVNWYKEHKDKYPEYADDFAVLDMIVNHADEVELSKAVSRLFDESYKKACKKACKRAVESVSKKRALKEGLRSNVIEFPSGDYVYVAVEGGKLYAGSATNTGIFHDYEIDIDGDEPTDSELQELYDMIAEKHPEYLDEMTESCKKRKKKIDESVKIISTLDDYEPWSGAKDTYEAIVDAGKLDDLDFYLEDIYPEGLTTTQLNDLLWFDGDTVLSDLGIYTEDAIDTAIQDAVDEAQGESFEDTDELESFLTSHIEDAMSGVSVHIDISDEEVEITVENTIRRFAVTDFTVGEIEESLKEAKEEVEDFYDVVYDTITGQKKIKGTSNPIRGCMNPDNMGIDKETGNMLAKCRTEKEADKVEKYVKDMFGDEGVTTTRKKNKYDKDFPIGVVIDVPEERVIKNIEDKVVTTDESLTESVEGVTVTTDTDVVNVDVTGTDGVTVDVQGKDSVDNAEEATIEPVSDETKEEIVANSEEGESEEGAEGEMLSDEFDEFNEEEFDELGESYLKEVYDNVKSFKTTRGVMDKDRIKLEGIIEFNSGKKAKTSFVFEKYMTTPRGKFKLLGENLQLTSRKNAFILTGSIQERKLCMEALTYKYTAKDAKGGKSKQVYGTKKLTK